MTREEAERNILKKVKEDKIGRHRQIIHLLSLCSIIKQIYDAHEAELKAKDERIEAQASVIIACQKAILQKDERITELETERDKYNTIAANLQISRQKAYDNIAELEAIIEKMKCCENCESHTNVGSKCLLDIEDSLECRANHY